MNSEVEDLFLQKGYYIFNSVFTTEEIASHRKELVSLFSSGHQRSDDIDKHERYGSIKFDFFNRYENLRQLVFHPGVIASLKRILGNNIIILPESAAHHNGFGEWHKDTNAQEHDGVDFHWKDGASFRMIQCAIYLQDNDAVYGGGLDVIPGSHLEPPPFSRFFRPGIGKKISRMIGTGPKPLTLPSKAGDLVTFDLRLDHKATASIQFPIPTEKDKYALFFIATNNAQHARNYLTYIKSRKDYLYLQNYSYQDSLLQIARHSGVTLQEV